MSDRSAFRDLEIASMKVGGSTLVVESVRDNPAQRSLNVYGSVEGDLRGYWSGGAEAQAAADLRRLADALSPAEPEVPRYVLATIDGNSGVLDRLTGQFANGGSRTDPEIFPAYWTRPLVLGDLPGRATEIPTVSVEPLPTSPVPLRRVLETAEVPADLIDRVEAILDLVEEVADRG